MPKYVNDNMLKSINKIFPKSLFFCIIDKSFFLSGFSFTDADKSQASRGRERNILTLSYLRSALYRNQSIDRELSHERGNCSLTLPPTRDNWNIYLRCLAFVYFFSKNLGKTEAALQGCSFEKKGWILSL